MFDTELTAPEALRDSDDATVVAAIEDWARAEAAAGARRLHAIAELVRRRSGSDDRADWSCDYWDSAAAEVAASLGVSHGMASGQMRMGITLRHRLPQVAALFMAGRISSRLVSVIAWRTYLVQDDDALRLIDAAVAEQATTWGALSALKLEQAVDLWIDRYDPAALRRTRASARSRGVEIGAADEQSGTTAMWGRLFATDAALLDRRLTQLAHALCNDDPRTIAQRRADALGALAAGSERLACTCGRPDCPHQGDDDARATSIVIHVIADAAAMDATPDPLMSGEQVTRPVTRDTTLVEALAPTPEPNATESCPQSSAGVIVGGGVAPTPFLAEMIRSGAKVRPIRRPDDTPEVHYRPSAALDEFVRMRDLTCRFPGCDHPAEFCDIDHTRPWPHGPTHPTNLKCVCRKQQRHSIV